MQFIFGPDGLTGVDGADGRTGPQGVPGEDGIGVPGRRGDPGQAGERGPLGQPGINALDGRKGTIGIVGSPAPRGPVGEFGVKGEKGEPGDARRSFRPSHNRVNRGRKGARGEPGTPGESGLPGRVGPEGDAGPAGPKGMASTLQGPRGPTGVPGEPGRDVSGDGGVVYTRWGSSTCPNGRTVELVYQGQMGSGAGNVSHAVNYLCMPENAEYIPLTDHGAPNRAFVHGTLYGVTTSVRVPSQPARGASCAVCLVSERNAVITIPAKLSCPGGWTREYSGFLMSGGESSSVYVCVDMSKESSQGSHVSHPVGVGGEIWHVEVSCAGFECPPYDSNQEVGCVVCSK